VLGCSRHEKNGSTTSQTKTVITEPGRKHSVETQTPNRNQPTPDAANKPRRKPDFKKPKTLQR